MIRWASDGGEDQTEESSSGCRGENWWRRRRGEFSRITADMIWWECFPIIIITLGSEILKGILPHQGRGGELNALKYQNPLPWNHHYKQGGLVLEIYCSLQIELPGFQRWESPNIPEIHSAALAGRTSETARRSQAEAVLETTSASSRWVRPYHPHHHHHHHHHNPH